MNNFEKTKILLEKESAQGIIDAEYDNLKDMAAKDVVTYLTDMGFSKAEAQKAVKNAGFKATGKKKPKTKDVVAAWPPRPYRGK